MKNAGIDPRLLLEEGDPATEIAWVAKEGGFGLIVIGHRGHSAVREFFLGTVSDRVVNRADRSVLVVRPERVESD